MELFTRYVIDTNIIIDLSRRIHPTRLRREANDVMQTLLATGSIVSHREVFLELESGAKQGDAALAWAKDNQSIFIDLTPSQEQHLVKVLSEHPDMIDLNKIEHDADPLLIALALDIGGVVVTGDGSTQRSGKKQIKDVCDAYSIRCIDVDEFLTENGWLIETSDSAAEPIGPAAS